MTVIAQVSLRAEEGGGEAIELLPGGAVHSVTPNNVYQYVKLYSELRMLRACQDSLLVSSATVLSRDLVSLSQLLYCHMT